MWQKSRCGVWESLKGEWRGFWGGLSRWEQILLVTAIMLTVMRIFLAMKIPLHIQGAAVYDDEMMVKNATSLLSGKWLGEFGKFTLAKGASFSLFFALNYVLGLPYTFSLAGLYIVAAILLCVALSKLVKSKGFLYFLYMLLLYSPAMFHDENVQKVYRGGVIAIFAMLVVACTIGIYTRIEERNKKVLRWAVGATLSLSFFWFLKEDSIWILPFVVGGAVCAIIRVARLKMTRGEKAKKMTLVSLPLVGLVVAIVGYKTVNYVAYGEFAITDRQGTYFKEVAGDLIRIEGEGRSAENWVTREMMKQAFAVSPTFALVQDEMDKQYESWAKDDGEIEGDIIFGR